MPKHLNITLRMTLIACICLLGLALIHLLTKKQIQKNENDHLQQTLSQALPKGVTDNILIQTKTEQDGYIFYQSCLDNQKNYLLVQATTMHGYSGKIVMITSFDQSSHIHKVLPLLHKETPGLGDKIEPKKSNWLSQFEAKSYQSGIQLKKDGGSIDAITGATITSRAVTNLIHEEVQYLKNHQPIMSCHES